MQAAGAEGHGSHLAGALHRSNAHIFGGSRAVERRPPP
eukprot:CAMPEP_0115867922 /NCGR_PEP_ID=MMETSP0287-20121206/21017_1 /TAXON_ID=412157 /ORGANISM="Chrysochromulina rotalis, Strain UIO044" /LENGTH=37 /DNA_ID= /DNA_START= /DNA_END= /DNA_ORIENTATION=